ncbi:MAG: hypothetical protein Q9183_004264, partial [Haloplaca sp. 2 TL-2023]
MKDLQVDQEKLQTENTSLVAAFREKSRKHQQTQELYDRLKRKEMTAATQSAAFESVDEVLGNVVGRSGGQRRSSEHSFIPRPHAQQEAFPYQYQYPRGRSLGHARDNSNGSGGSGDIRPPFQRPQAFGNHLFGKGHPSTFSTRKADHLTGNNDGTPSQHRTQLGPHMQNAGHKGAGHISSGFATGLSGTPSQRLHLGTMNPNVVNRPNMGGYGMSAGLKVGRQQG